MLFGTRRRVAAAVATVAAAALLALTLGGRGCEPADASPDGVVRAFIAASRSGDRRAAWELLGPATRKQLEDAAAGATNKVGGTQRVQPLDMLEVGANEATYTPTSVRVAERSGSDAIVEVTGPEGQKDQVRVVRVGRRWRVELDLE